MKNSRNPYRNFPNFVLRTPIVSFNYYKKLTAEDVISNEVLKEAYDEPLVKEACFLASPPLYFEMLHARLTECGRN